MSYKGMETIEDLRPRTVTHENSLLWASLSQCMENNLALRESLKEAQKTIEELTELVEKLK